MWQYCVHWLTASEIKKNKHINKEDHRHGYSPAPVISFDLGRKKDGQHIVARRKEYSLSLILMLEQFSYVFATDENEKEYCNTP